MNKWVNEEVKKKKKNWTNSKDSTDNASLTLFKSTQLLEDLRNSKTRHKVGHGFSRLVAQGATRGLHMGQCSSLCSVRGLVYILFRRSDDKGGMDHKLLQGIRTDISSPWIKASHWELRFLWLLERLWSVTSDKAHMPVYLLGLQRNLGNTAATTQMISLPGIFNCGNCYRS